MTLTVSKVTHLLHLDLISNAIFTNAHIKILNFLAVN